jgi:ketosteroid isomerase-like protein
VAGNEIPIERCDRLPIVTAYVDGLPMKFLVDTAATSMLNVKSFSEGRSKDIHISSWSGIAITSARQVILPELLLGRYRLREVRLPAIDLSPIGRSCGGQIDGILGVDLLEKMGATIDLKNRVALLAMDETADGAPAEYQAVQRACVAAFNRADAEAFRECLDPEAVFYTAESKMKGRDEVLAYFRRNYFEGEDPARLELRVADYRVLGDAVWHEYQYTIRIADDTVEGRGMAICRKSGGRYRLLNMHTTRVETAASPE